MKNLTAVFAAFLILVFFSCKEELTQNETKNIKKPKNILFIAVDDLKPKLFCYGDTIVKTPNIDKLASSGYVFLNNHCQQAVCAPSRASVLTGKRPDFTKVWDLKTLIRDKNPDIVTMPQYFKQLGYTTAAVGKIFDFRSVDKLNDSVSWTYKYDNFKHNSQIGHEYVNETERVSSEIIDVPDSLTADGEVARRTIANLRKFAKQGEPFFMAAGFYKPHLPFVAPKKYWDLYNREDFKLPLLQTKPEGAPDYATQPSWELRHGYVDVSKDYGSEIPIDKQLELIHGYNACVSFVDQQIGDVLDELDRLGLRENTIIVLWGDHGWHLGDHGMFCKHTNYEQSTRSPLIFSVAGKDAGSTKSPTELVDIYPTLCELANVETPTNLDGKSLLPIMENKTSKIKDFAVSQFPRNGNLMGYAFRTERYRYVVWLKDNFRSTQEFNVELIEDEELYDYETDPLETKNLVLDKNYIEIKENLLAQATEFFKQQEIKK